MENQLHVNHVQLAVELEPNLFQMADFFKPGPSMQRYTRGVIRIDAGNDCVVTKLAGAANQLLQHERPKSSTMVLVVDIDRILHRAAVR